MKTQAEDTSIQAEEIQIALLREKTPAEKLRLLCSLTDTAIRLSKRAILRANPGISELELKLLFIKLHYGQELADKVRPAMEKKFEKP